MSDNPVKFFIRLEDGTEKEITMVSGIMKREGDKEPALSLYNVPLDKAIEYGIASLGFMIRKYVDEFHLYLDERGITDEEEREQLTLGLIEDTFAQFQKMQRDIFQ